MKPVSLLVVRSSVLTGLLLFSAFALVLGQTGQHQSLPTAPLEQYDDPPAQAPSPTPTSPSPSPTPTGTASGTPTPGGSPSPTCCMFTGTVSSTCQFHAASNTFDINISALINNPCNQAQMSPANFYMEGSTDGANFEFIVRTSIENYTLQPGQNNFNAAFLNQIIPDQYQFYRVRMQFYNCGIYSIYAPVAPVCRPGGTPGGTPTPSPGGTPTPGGTPSPTPPPTVSISGNVSYCSSPSLGPVPGVTLTLTGTTSSTTFSDSSGNYFFSSLPSGGNYTVTPSKATLTPGSTGINTVDVIAIQRHFLVLGTPLSGCRLTAADVDTNTTINTVDVIAVQRFFLTLTTGISNTGKYQFTPANHSYSGISSNQTGQNYNALIFGDVATPFVH